jgi:GxxExxY protein
MEDDFLYRDESYLIIGCCMEVHKQLGCGFKEAVYQEALEMEFIENDLVFERERKLKIHYKVDGSKRNIRPILFASTK